MLPCLCPFKALSCFSEAMMEPLSLDPRTTPPCACLKLIGLIPRWTCDLSALSRFWFPLSNYASSTFSLRSLRSLVLSMVSLFKKAGPPFFGSFMVLFATLATGSLSALNAFV